MKNVCPFPFSISQDKHTYINLRTLTTMYTYSHTQLTGAGANQCVHLLQTTGQSPEQCNSKTKSKVSPASSESQEVSNAAKTNVETTSHTISERVIPSNWSTVDPSDSVDIQAMPPLEQPAVQQATQPGLQPSELSEAEAKRLCSESNRMLLVHPEHAMTLAELLDCFKSSEDPANPTADQLYRALVVNNKKPGSGGKNPAKLFQVCV